MSIVNSNHANSVLQLLVVLFVHFSSLSWKTWGVSSCTSLNLPGRSKCGMTPRCPLTMTATPAGHMKPRNVPRQVVGPSSGPSVQTTCGIYIYILNIYKTPYPPTLPGARGSAQGKKGLSPPPPPPPQQQQEQEQQQPKNNQLLQPQPPQEPQQQQQNGYKLRYVKKITPYSACACAST